MTTHYHPIQFEQGAGGEVVVNVPNVRIKLIRNTKGYAWEISVAGDSVENVAYDTREADDWLRSHYGSTD